MTASAILGAILAHLASIVGESRARLNELPVALRVPVRHHTDHRAGHRLAIFIKKNVSGLKIAMQNSLAMSVSDPARDLCHQLHTLARLCAKRRRRGTKTPARDPM